MTFIIAEAGVNHGGDVAAALKLCDAAKAAHADAVKFQCFSSQKLWNDDRIRHLELSEADFIKINWHCHTIGLEFMATPFDVQSVAFLLTLGVKRMKIASGCLTRHELIEAIPPEMPVIVSTGMSDFADVALAIGRIPNPLTLLHCVSRYPCPDAAVNLNAMHALRALCPQVGYSCHTETGLACIAAAALGATVIEKHLTLDRTLPGPDHAASIEPMTFAMMVQAIRQVEVMLGEAAKRIQPEEEALRKLWR